MGGLELKLFNQIWLLKDIIFKRIDLLSVVITWVMCILKKQQLCV